MRPGAIHRLLAGEIREVEALVRRMVLLRLHVGGTDGRFLGPAVDDVESAAARVREYELARVALLEMGPVVGGVGDDGCDPDLLHRQHAELAEAVTELHEVHDETEQLLTIGRDAVRGVLDHLGGVSGPAAV